jgi:hypothetical protein
MITICFTCIAGKSFIKSETREFISTLDRDEAGKEGILPSEIPVITALGGTIVSIR